MRLTTRGAWTIALLFVALLGLAGWTVERTATPIPAIYEDGSSDACPACGRDNFPDLLTR